MNKMITVIRDMTNEKEETKILYKKLVEKSQKTYIKRVKNII